MDLILTPKVAEDWKFADTFGEEYMKTMLLGMAKKIASSIQSEK